MTTTTTNANPAGKAARAPDSIPVSPEVSGCIRIVLLGRRVIKDGVPQSIISGVLCLSRGIKRLLARATDNGIGGGGIEFVILF